MYNSNPLNVKLPRCSSPLSSKSRRFRLSRPQSRTRDFSSPSGYRPLSRARDLILSRSTRLRKFSFKFESCVYISTMTSPFPVPRDTVPNDPVGSQTSLESIVSNSYVSETFSSSSIATLQIVYFSYHSAMKIHGWCSNIFKNPISKFSDGKINSMAYLIVETLREGCQNVHASP